MSDKRFQVFLSHHSGDKPAVKYLAERLLAEGINPFLDEWHLVPGAPWQEGLEKALNESETCAVFLGPHGPGTWENEEMRVALDRRARSRLFRVIPVLLPNTTIPEHVDLPAFLSRLTWVDFRSGLADPEAFRRLLCGIRDEEPGPPRSRVAEPGLLGPTIYPGVTAHRPEDRPPFRGIESFRAEDADLFFGRAALTQYLVDRLRNRRFLAVIGPSGSGKSSLIRAGLIPALRRGVLPSSETWEIVLFKPGRTPLRELAARLLRDLADPEMSLIDQIDRFSTEMDNNFCALAAEVRRMARSQILLIVDQLEEVFTQTSMESERQAFLGNLLDASSLVTGKVIVIAILRADFYAKVAAYPGLADRIAARQVIVTPMLESDLWQAIAQPASRSGLRFEDGLVDQILREMQGQFGALPLLQQALLELWKRREGNVLTFSAYRAIRGVKGAIAGWANSVYESLSNLQQSLARRILINLVQPGERDTRRRVLLNELSFDPDQASEAEAVLELLIQDRLLTTDRDFLTGDKLVEIAHEALLQEWPLLHEWLEKSRASRLFRFRLQEQVRVWNQYGRDSGSLLRGAELTAFELWSRENRGEISPQEEEYLEASLNARRSETEQRELLERILNLSKTTLEALDVRGAVLQDVQAIAAPLQRPDTAPPSQVRPVRSERSTSRQAPQLALPVFPWRPNIDPPGALLRAQYRVVPFHGREKEFRDLQAWCRDPAPVGIRLYTGPAGAGKTRLALETALKMRRKGWRAGFITAEALKSPERTWKALALPRGKLLLIIDYADTNRPFLISVLREMHDLQRGPVRLMLLARAALDWWEQLKSERDGVGELLGGQATYRYSLQPLADSVDSRRTSYVLASQAFSEHLHLQPRLEPPPDLVADRFKDGLLLHIRALIDLIEGQKAIKEEDGILDRILARERMFWSDQANKRGLSREVSSRIGQVVAAITLRGGVEGEDEAKELLRGLRFFANQSEQILQEVARLLHECYPGKHWIEPLEPDLLGEHLVQRELEKGADELLDLVLGPRSGA